MTTKERTETHNLSSHWTEHASYLGNPDYINNSGDESRGYSLKRSRTGQSSSNWKALVKKGENASTPFTAVEESASVGLASFLIVQSSRGTLDMPWLTVTRTNSGHVGALPAIPIPGGSLTTPGASEALAGATRKLYKKVRRVHSQFAGGVFAGELRKTVSMIAGKAKLLRKAVLNFRQFGRETSKLLKDRELLKKRLADAYLEAVFGWMPLVSDIEDGMKALRRLQKDFLKERFKVLHAVVTPTEDAGVQHVYGNITFLTKHLWKRTDTCLFYGAFRGSAIAYAEGDASLQRVLDLSGFNFREFIPTVWELIPYSFLVDYFCNIGDVLNACTTDTSLVAWVTRVEVSLVEDSCILDFDRKAYSDWYALPENQGYARLDQMSGGPSITNLKTRSVTRTPLSSMPVLLPRLEHPAMWSRQVANIAALLLSRGSLGSRR